MKFLTLVDQRKSYLAVVVVPAPVPKRATVVSSSLAPPTFVTAIAVRLEKMHSRMLWSTITCTLAVAVAVPSKASDTAAPVASGSGSSRWCGRRCT